VYQGTIYKDHCLNSSSPTYDRDQWVRVEMVVHGSGTITHYVNGMKVLEYSMPQYGGGVVDNYDATTKPDGKLMDGGYISLQSESHPIDFRKVELLNLAGCTDKAASNYKSYYVKSVPEDCKFAEGVKPAMRRPGEYPVSAEALPQEGIPKGRLEGPFEFRSSIIAGTVRRYWIFVPAQYNPKTPANVPGRPARHESRGRAARTAGHGEPHRQRQDAGDHRHLHHAGKSERHLPRQPRHQQSESPQG
jgi:hypothetical protein